MLIPNLKSDWAQQVRILNYTFSHHMLCIIVPFTNYGFPFHDIMSRHLMPHAWGLPVQSKWESQMKKWFIKECLLMFINTFECIHSRMMCSLFLMCSIIYTRERANARTRERANARTRERANARTRERANAQTRKRANAQTRKRANPQTRKPANAQTRLSE